LREIAVVEAVRGGHTEVPPAGPPTSESSAILSQRVRSEASMLEILKELIKRARTNADAADWLRMRP